MKTLQEDITQACNILQQGGIILYPTDTIWGIGCDATNSDAVKRVYEIKRRIDTKALIILTDAMSKVDYYIEDVPPIAYDLVELSHKPLTIVYDGARNLAPELIAEDGSVGIRVTQEAVSQTLCRRFRKAIVSTSANISGEKSPATFAEISDEIKQAVDYIMEARRDENYVATPSSIVKLSAGGLIKIIRE